MDGWLDGRTNGWMDGRMYASVHLSTHSSSHQSVRQPSIIHTTYIECCVTKCPVLQAFGARLGRLSGEAPPTD